MAVTESPFGTYADVTGVVDATAAAEIVALLAVLTGLIPDGTVPSAVSGGVPEAHPDFDAVRPEYAELILGEITALAAAIAAAPTS